MEVWKDIGENFFNLLPAEHLKVCCVGVLSFRGNHARGGYGGLCLAVLHLNRAVPPHLVTRMQCVAKVYFLNDNKPD